MFAEHMIHLLPVPRDSECDGGHNGQRRHPQHAELSYISYQIPEIQSVTVVTMGGTRFFEMGGSGG